jgi:phage-related protein
MHAVYYRTPDGDEPVSAFLGRLPPQARAAVAVQVARLNQLEPSDPPLPFPYSSQVIGELRELRCHFGNRQFRLLYRRSESPFILLHIFEKRTRAVPAEESKWHCRAGMISGAEWRSSRGDRPGRPATTLGEPVPR